MFVMVILSTFHVFPSFFPGDEQRSINEANNGEKMSTTNKKNFVMCFASNKDTTVLDKVLIF